MNHETLTPVAASPKPYTASNAQIWAWAIGGIASHGMIGVYGQAGNIFIVGFGLSAVMVGWTSMLPRVFDAILDPFLGHLSDNTHTRWGRRKPFLVIASVLGALLLSAVYWASKSWGQQAQFLYLLVTGVLFYCCYGLYTMTWTALGFELSDDYNERARVAAYGGLILTAILLANSWLYWFALRPMFGNEVTGMRWISAGAGVLVIAAALVTTLVCRERFTHANVRKHTPILPALRTTLKTRPFVLLLLFRFFQLFGERVNGSLMFYLGIYYVCLGDKNLATKITGIGGMIGAFWGIALVPFMKTFSRKFGKQGGLMLGSGCAFAAALAQPLILNPAYPYLLLIPWLLIIPLTAISNTMANAIVPDICDADELRTGERREGLFTAVLGFVAKLEISLTILIVGYLVSFAGFDSKLPSQPPEVLKRMFWLAIGPNVLFTLGAFIVAIKFPMNEASMLKIRRELDARHQAHPEEAPLAEVPLTPPAPPRTVGGTAG